MQTGFLRDIGKCTVAVVVVQVIPVNPSHEQIQIAIIVVVAHGNAVREAGASESGSLSDVLEIPFAVVFKQSVGVFG